MGYYVKNRETHESNAAIRIPSGVTIDRPSSPIFGQIRFNTDLGSLEFYDGTTWQTINEQGSIVVDTFTGDGTTAIFGPMTNAIGTGDDDQIIVFVGNIYQIPTTNYTTNGAFDITFTSAPGNGLPINVIHNLGSTTET
jgi:hypothetical protein